MSAPHASSEPLVGQSLGRYRIEERIGAGGMGVVYRATDTTLDRSVALKLLPEHCARDADRRSRFEREARLLAALNHRNIAAIYGLETSGDLCFLVLELVPGETLARLLSAKRLDTAEVLQFTRQIAEALEAAHERGIVHRDLKPANVKITPSGELKVLDFGLAKALGSVLNGPDATTALMDETQSGMILGTAGYMSPEQARGKPVDKRTDIWAFGCVLYEMLAGRRAFDGDTASDCVAAILGTDPDWTAIGDAVPKNVVKVLRRCLAKDPQHRWRDMGDVLLEMDEPSDGRALAEPGAPSARRHASLIGATLLAAVVVTAGTYALVEDRRAAPVVTRFTIPMSPGEVVNPTGTSVRLSADGSQLAWVGVDITGRTQIYVRHLNEFDGKPLEGTASGASPFFSPDNRWVGFAHGSSRTFRKASLSGGAPVIMASFESAGGASWVRPDEIVTAVQYPGPLVRVPAAGGMPAPITKLDPASEEKIHMRPAVLPGGKAVLFEIGAAGMENWDEGRIAVLSLETGERRILIEGGAVPMYSPTGHIVYARDGKLLAVPFDVKRLAVTGPPVTVLSGVFMCINTGTAHYSLAQNGTLAYAPGAVLGGYRQLVWVDRQGKEDPLPVPQKAYLHPRLSPDGKRVAVEVEGPTHDFWSYDFESSVLSKVTTEGMSHWPLWTPDGSHLTYRRWLDGTFSMWWMPSDRSTTPERLTDMGKMQSASSWSPDGSVIALTQVNPDTGPDVYVMDISNRKPRPFVQTRFAEGSPRFSSDGRYVAYTSNESGRNEIYVQAFPGPGPKVQVSTDGGTDAVWKRNGGELYYRDGDKMMVAAVSTGAVSFAKPRILWTSHYAHGLGSVCGAPGTTSSNYDVAADGQRFLMIKHKEEAPARINVIVNWTEELKRAAW
jgi:hypothetical protein